MDQYGKIIHEWLYPAPSGLVFKWCPDKDTDQSGIGVIFIPTQAPETKPFLLTRTIGDKKTTEIQLGYTERHLDRTDIKSVVELHHAIRTGLNLEATLLNRITNLETLLQRQLATTLIPQPSSTGSPVIRATRFSVMTMTNVRVPPNCWGIRTGGAARFVDGDFVQTESYRQVVNLYRDGELIIAVQIDSYSLAWSDNTNSRLHPLAFVEFVTNTLGFFRLVLADMRIEPQTLQIEIRLRNLLRDSLGTLLPAGPINNLGWASGFKLAPSAEWSRTIVVAASSYDPTRAAFLLLREVYVWFGHPEEAIPYTHMAWTPRTSRKQIVVRDFQALRAMRRILQFFPQRCLVKQVGCRTLRACMSPERNRTWDFVP